MKLSLVIITHNEEERLRPALESSRDLVDEIIVCDSFSSDGTLRIAKEFGATIIQHPFQDYGSQKNLAMSKASGEWILNLDADERLSEQLRASIARWKAGPEPDVDGYRIRRKTHYLGRWIQHSGWYPERKLRLFKKVKARWEGRVHERLELSGSCGILAGDILHFTYRNLEDHLARVNRYSTFQAEEIVTQGKKMLLLRALVLPPISFLRHYLWRLGFLDGFAGLVIALLSSWTTCLKFLKAIELKKSRCHHRAC